MDQKWGVAGLTASAGVAGWVEFMLLRQALGERIGKTPLAPSFTIRLWSVATSAAAVGYFIKLGIGVDHPSYSRASRFRSTARSTSQVQQWLGVTESRTMIEAVTRRLGGNLQRE